LEEKIKIGNDDNLNTLSEKLSILSAKLFLNATSLIEENINKNTNFQLTKQDTLGKEITYARMIEKSDFKVDWGNDAIKISQKIKALKNYEKEPDEAKEIINNALGFSYAAQNEFKKAIKHYKSAIKSLPEYPIALNNLASAQQRLLEYDLAYETNQKVLVIDPKNKTAIKKSKELEKRNNYEPYKGIKDKGF